MQILISNYENNGVISDFCIDLFQTLLSHLLIPRTLTDFKKLYSFRKNKLLLRLSQKHEVYSD